MQTVGWMPSPNGRGAIDIIFANVLALFVSRSDSSWAVFLRRCRWATLAVTAPEMLTLFAVMQRNAANTSWTLVHAFYANAGGFVLQTPDFPPFPTNATSIHHLCSQKRIELPDISRDNVWDRSKADHFAKCVALTQVGQQLTVTPLEVFTVAFVVPSINVAEPTVIRKPAWDGWRRRPSLLHFGGLKKRPLTRIPNDYSPPPSTGTEATIVWVVSVVHAALHVLWRASSLTLLAVTAIGGLVPVLSTYPWSDFSFSMFMIWEREARKQTFARRWLFSLVADSAYVLYILARLVILVEIFAAFRAMPEDVYFDVDWASFWPHGA
ncbi:uncharacterized protein B0T15DRAFT_568666 [Chaetomium strumarium]|uniref:Uncharacterized protein n=1 Tax=Chaetomium strumarium TaxID=1170767 RepID=A0AAJ0LZ39_9PEZI|nr:hypothetical protein B0T15DRAFT_568666 [Chaetomium strumarium]